MTAASTSAIAVHGAIEVGPTRPDVTRSSPLPQDGRAAGGGADEGARHVAVGPELGTEDLDGTEGVQGRGADGRV